MHASSPESHLMGHVWTTRLSVPGIYVPPYVYLYITAHTLYSVKLYFLSHSGISIRDCILLILLYNLHLYSLSSGN